MYHSYKLIFSDGAIGCSAKGVQGVFLGNDAITVWNSEVGVFIMPACKRILKDVYQQ